jgi:hypothetical protein
VNQGSDNYRSELLAQALWNILFYGKKAYIKNNIENSDLGACECK